MRVVKPYVLSFRAVGVAPAFRGRFALAVPAAELVILLGNFLLESFQGFCLDEDPVQRFKIFPELALQAVFWDDGVADVGYVHGLRGVRGFGFHIAQPVRFAGTAGFVSKQWFFAKNGNDFRGRDSHFVPFEYHDSKRFQYSHALIKASFEVGFPGGFIQFPILLSRIAAGASVGVMWGIKYHQLESIVLKLHISEISEQIRPNGN